MILSYFSKGDTLVVLLGGELDHHSASTVREALDHMLSDTNYMHLVLDMQQVSFMDSSGIGVILGRHRLISARGGDIAVRNVKPQVQRIMDMADLSRIVRKA